MPEIPLLEPTVLRGVVEKLDKPETLVLSNALPSTPWPYPTVSWDVIKGSRMIAKPNVPNSEAHIVPRLGISQESAAFVYLREKKVFEPTTLHWLRAPGTLSNRQNAETAVLRELKDLNQRIDNFVEWACWQALTGTLTFDYNDVQATVDYKIPSSHKPTVGTSWATATPQQIVNDIKAWKRLISRDARVKANDVWLTEPTLDRIFNAFAANGNSSAPYNAATLLSDRMKDQYYQSGVLPGFLGLNWHTVESFYDDDSGAATQFLADDAVILSNLTEGRAMEIMVGPTADDEAPDGFTGKFSKTWQEKDPSARQVLVEYNFLPVMTRPEQVVYVGDVTPA
jgi:hypothetical protein